MSDENPVIKKRQTIFYDYKPLYKRKETARTKRIEIGSIITTRTNKTKKIEITLEHTIRLGYLINGVIEAIENILLIFGYTIEDNVYNEKTGGGINLSRQRYKN